MSGHRPPRLLERLVEWCLPPGLSSEAALGDLAEGFEHRALESLLIARLWYLGQTASIVAYRTFPRPFEASDSDLWMDLRWSVRAMARRPWFTLSVVLVLGAGMGANLAVFSVVDGTFRDRSWWAEPERTLAIWPENGFSLGQLDLYHEEQSAYRSLGAYAEQAVSVRLPDGESRSVNAVVVTPQLFRELAVQPTSGRGLADEDGRFGAEPVAVLGDRLWRESFGADPLVVGRRIDIGGRPTTVVGIQGSGGAAPGGRTELWLPIVPDPRDDDYFKAQGFALVGALSDGVTAAMAHEDLMAFTRRLSALFPMFYPDGFAEGRARVTRADEAQRKLVRTPLLLLFVGTVTLLLATALNVGSLLLGRAVDRRRELAVRASLGASDRRVAGQLVVEGTVLTGLAAAVALAIGSAGGSWVARLFAEEVVVVRSDVFTPPLLVFGLASAGLAWLLVNGVTIAHFLRDKRSAFGHSMESGTGFQRTIVAVQAALATLLLVNATLLVRTVENLRDVPLGFDPEGIIAVAISPPDDRVESTAVAGDLYRRLSERVSSVPGVTSVGITGWLPLRAQAPGTPINLRSAPVDPREALRAPMHMVDPGFFEVFDVRPVAGRLLQATDLDATRPSAVVVNESLARTLWPDGSAVGQMIAIDPHAWNTWAPVVGVIPDIRSGSITDPPAPALYVSLFESPSRDVTLVVRGEATASALSAPIRRAVSDVDPLVPIRSISEMDEVVRAAYSTSWVVMALLTLLAVLATGLGTVGIYAVLAHHVAASRGEIGVRMALGARPATVVGGVVRSGLGIAGLGIAVGTVGAAASTRFLESLLYEVSTLEPGAFIAPVIALSAAAALAAWIPAARAGRLPPAEALRRE